MLRRHVLRQRDKIIELFSIALLQKLKKQGDKYVAMLN